MAFTVKCEKIKNGVIPTLKNKFVLEIKGVPHILTPEELKQVHKAIAPKVRRMRVRARKKKAARRGNLFAETD